jgi:hypothetical protein
MAAKRISRTVLRNCGLYVTTTLFENAGDTAVTTMQNVQGVVTMDTYTRKHVIFKGSFKASFPGTDQPDELSSVGDVAPTRDTYIIQDSQFVIEALEDNSQYYCVIPGYLLDKLSYQTIDLAAGESRTINQGTLGFVFGTDYTINGSAATDTEVVACENNSAQIQAVTPCQVIEFVVVKANA